LSSLDVAVGRAIWEECLVSYLRHKTRIIVTHQTHFLQDSRVDRIVVLNREGRVHASGTFSDLASSTDPFVLEAILGHHNDRAEESSDEEEEDVDRIGGGYEETKSPGHGAEDEGVESEEDEEDEAQVEGEKVAFMDQEERREGRIDTKLLWQYLLRFGGGSSVAYPLLILGAFVTEQSCNVVQSLWLSRLTEPSAAVASEQAREIGWLMLLGLGLCCVTAVRILLVVWGALTAGNSLHSSMLTSLIHAPVRFFDRQLSGRILNRFISDQSSIDSIVPSTLADFFQQLLYFTATLVIMCYSLPEMLVLVLILAIPYRAVSDFYRWPARDLRRLEAMSKSPVNSQFTEAIKGFSVIRAFAAQDRFMVRHLQLSSQSMLCYWTKVRPKPARKDAFSLAADKLHRPLVLRQWIANQWVTIWLEMIGTLFVLGCGILTVWATTDGAPSLVHDNVDAGKLSLMMSTVRTYRCGAVLTVSPGRSSCLAGGPCAQQPGLAAQGVLHGRDRVRERGARVALRPAQVGGGVGRARAGGRAGGVRER
jgi:ABC-type multidrug transport system fused ATPase/permease subunit